MKKYHFIWLQSIKIQLLAFWLLISCSGDKVHTLEKGLTDKDAEVKNMINKSEGQLTNLAETIPMTREMLKTWLPDLIGEFKKTKTIAGHLEAAEMSGIVAIYQHDSDSSKIITIEILDGAGPVASVLLSGVQQKLELDFEELFPTGFSRVYENNGLRVWEQENRNLKTSDLEYIQQDRYHVMIRGQQVRIGDLRLIAENLEIGNRMTK